MYYSNSCYEKGLLKPTTTKGNPLSSIFIKPQTNLFRLNGFDLPFTNQGKYFYRLGAGCLVEWGVN